MTEMPSLSRPHLPPGSAPSTGPLETPREMIPSLQPYRGATILTLVILSIIWILGNSHLRLMNASIIDPSGRGTTQPGKICGIIGVTLVAVGLGLCLIQILVLSALFVSVSDRCRSYQRLDESSVR